MKSVNIADAKAKLSEILSELKPGEVVVLCRRNVPVAELRALPRPEDGQRPWGKAKGTFRVPRDFNDPLPPSDLAAWYEGEVYPK